MIDSPCYKGTIWEIHFNIVRVDEPRYRYVDINDLWEDSKKIKVDGVPCSIFSIQGQVIHLLCQYFESLYFDMDLRSLFEIAVILRNMNNTEIRLLNIKLKKHRLVSIFNFTLENICSIFDLDIKHRIKPVDDVNNKLSRNRLLMRIDDEFHFKQILISKHAEKHRLLTTFSDTLINSYFTHDGLQRMKLFYSRLKDHFLFSYYKSYDIIYGLPNAVRGKIPLNYYLKYIVKTIGRILYAFYYYYLFDINEYFNKTYSKKEYIPIRDMAVR